MATGGAAALQQALGEIVVATRGTGFVDITGSVGAWLEGQRCRDGLLTLLIQHTSASLTIQENADPDVRGDLVTALDRLAPADAGWVHDSEGPDDMPAHVKTMLTGVNLAVPVRAGRMLLGVWQGLYLAEHRADPHRRTVAVHFVGTIG